MTKEDRDELIKFLSSIKKIENLDTNLILYRREVIQNERLSRKRR